jgi:hypothetical protein
MAMELNFPHPPSLIPIIVTIGITVGLFASTCVVYAFTSLSKRNKNKSTAF